MRPPARCRRRRTRPVPTSSGRRRPRRAAAARPRAPRPADGTSRPGRARTRRPPAAAAGSGPRRTRPRSRSTSAGSSAVRTICAISAERSGSGRRRANAAASAPPERPGSAAGIASTQRHSSGIAWRTSSGAGCSVLAAHAALDDETAEREGPQADRRAGAASGHARQRRRIGRPPGQRGQRRRHGERQLRARAEAGVRRDRLEHPHPGARRMARARRGSARPRPVRARRPPRRRSARRRRSPPRSPPGGRPPPRGPRTAARPRPRRRACPGAGARAPRRGPSSSVADGGVHVRQDVVHRRPLARAGRLVDQDGEALQLGADLVRGQPSRTREARIEASSTAWQARLKPMNSRPVPRPTTRVVTSRTRPGRLDRVDRDLAPGARVGEHGAVDGRRRARRRVRIPERGLREQQDVVGQVDDRGAARPGGCAACASRGRA